MIDEKFHLKVSSREGIVYEGEVIAITSYNDVGKFDVLAKHANFISLIFRGIYITEKYGIPEKEIIFNNALVKVKDNIAEVYIGVEGMMPI
ncbi:hypothetical protein A2159_02455 [Candidatus Woesebacteria bacterium RBG_13_34_9]|uniref:ATP synthase F1 complex delta/epsilon subunit N-terminal domain-containing protein n=1 Tax=Candidatus Woesebacteria bacterium RBG_13_34_9 TaxID=1802477 RepID=A0A1F7X6Z3_9BACT|nr:MAG: hypothetical protein A2159_02455 [Candidatus Woesebacteria bacterium RBG_13_34_9]